MTKYIDLFKLTFADVFNYLNTNLISSKTLVNRYYNVYNILADDYGNTIIVLYTYVSYYNPEYVLGGLPRLGIRLRNPLCGSVDHVVRQRFNTIIIDCNRINQAFTIELPLYLVNELLVTIT